MNVGDVNHKYGNGTRRFYVFEDGSYMVIRVRKNAFRGLVNAALIGIKTKEAEGNKFPPSVVSMVLSLIDAKKKFVTNYKPQSNE